MIKARKFFIKHFYNILSVVSVGFPFAAYKFLAGDAIKNLSGGSPAGIFFFYLFIIWAAIDFLLNFNALMSVIISGKYPKNVCILAVIENKIKYADKIHGIGVAIDLFLSFCIVAWVVGGNLFGALSPGYIYIWNASTVLNVLGAGIARLSEFIIDEVHVKQKKNEEEQQNDCD